MRTVRDQLDGDGLGYPHKRAQTVTSPLRVFLVTPVGRETRRRSRTRIVFVVVVVDRHQAVGLLNLNDGAAVRIADVPGPRVGWAV